MSGVDGVKVRLSGDVDNPTLKIGSMRKPGRCWVTSAAFPAAQCQFHSARDLANAAAGVAAATLGNGIEMAASIIRGRRSGVDNSC
jgi:hypothetical protein